MSTLREAAKIAVKDCMAVQPGETVLVITDINKRKIGAALWRAAKEAGAEAMLTEIIPRKTNGEELPAALIQMMCAVNVVLGPTTKSFTHTNGRRLACEKGARIATLPGVTEDMMIRTLTADYHRVAGLSLKFAEILDKGKVARVTTPRGTDITLPIEGRHPHPDTGLFHHPGDFGNLPAGEAFLAPVEGQTNGVIVVDGAMAGLGVLKKSFIKIVVRDGYAEEITGGKEAEQLEKLIKPLGKPARNIAELGVGTNYKAKLTGFILEDEKAIGTVHIALGDNMSMGGTVRVASHLDGILKKPTLEVDGQIIMKDGKLMV